MRSVSGPCGHVRGTVHRLLMGEPNRLSALWPSERAFIETESEDCFFLNRDTCCNTHIRVVTLNACRKPGGAKENQNERRTLWSHWELRTTYFEGTHQSRASCYGGRP